MLIWTTFLIVQHLVLPNFGVGGGQVGGYYITLYVLYIGGNMGAGTILPTVIVSYLHMIQVTYQDRQKMIRLVLHQRLWSPQSPVDGGKG